MNARETILSRLKKSAQSLDFPSPWVSKRNYPNLADQFETALTKVHGEVVRADNADMALETLGFIVSEIGGTKIVVNDDLLYSVETLRSALPSVEWMFVEGSQTPVDSDPLQSFCAQADIGLSGARALLAETGSAVIVSGPGLSRQATLLPPVHICIAPTSILTSDLFTWIATRKSKWAANVVLVSGPSKTADIEQTMAIGVHGPKRFIVILYED